MIGASILQLHEGNTVDESIKSYEYDEYQPITGTQLNSFLRITITIENQDKLLHLHNIYLLIEGDVLKADNNRYADADLIALTNNEANTGWTDGGTRQLPRSGYITPRFGDLLTRLFKRIWIDTRLLIPDLQYANGSSYKSPTRKEVFKAPFQCGIYSVSRMTTQR